MIITIIIVVVIININGDTFGIYTVMHVLILAVKRWNTLQTLSCSCTIHDDL